MTIRDEKREISRKYENRKDEGLRERKKESMKERKIEKKKEGKKKGKKADEGKLVGTDINGQGRKEGGTLPHEVGGTRTRSRLRLSLSSKRGKSNMRSM